MLNWHPGSSTGKCTREEAIANIARGINEAHRKTSSITLVIENAAEGKNKIGSQFEDLRDIIELVEDKSRVGVCIDSCHAFAAGYDFRTPDAYEATMKQFEDIVGLTYLKSWHINDSKVDLGAGRDLHENIGMGHLGLSSFAKCVTASDDL